MARTRTTKKVAQRIDLNYFKRATPFKRARLWLSALAPAVALAWALVHFFGSDPSVYSSGRLSEPHAVLEKECSVCHLQAAGSFSSHASDRACVACHDAPAHHPSMGKQLECAECHAEHRGRVNLSATRNAACAACHADLGTHDKASHFASGIISFETGHPEFAALRATGGTVAADPGSIKLNHSLHMKPIRQSPNGPAVQLECGDCHRSAASTEPWKYGDAGYSKAAVSYTNEDNFRSIGASGFAPPHPLSGRELMAPVRFADACAGCHLLTFDKRFTEGVPHDKPEAVHAFVTRKFDAYIATHADELREVQDPSRMLSGRPRLAHTQSLTASQWVAQKTAVAEELLWKKTCSQCHAMTSAKLQDTSIARWTPEAAAKALRSYSGSLAPAVRAVPPDSGRLPTIAPASVTLRWLPHSRFDHDAHRGFSCESCHQKALSSTESSDILIPGIATCRTCHAPGPQGAESRCFECHTYHDWSKRKEVRPIFTLPALRTGR